MTPEKDFGGHPFWGSKWVIVFPFSFLYNISAVSYTHLDVYKRQGPKRRAAQKRALDAAVKAGVNRLVYTSIVGAGEPDIDTYEVNDHVWFEAYVKEQPIHYLFLRDSQYAEAMVSNYINAYTNTDNVLANNMADGKMAYISRDDCAVACAYAAMSDWQDRVIDVNGAELLTLSLIHIYRRDYVCACAR